MILGLLCALLTHCRDYALTPTLSGPPPPADAGSEGVDSVHPPGPAQGGGDGGASGGGHGSAPSGNPFGGRESASTAGRAGNLAAGDARVSRSTPCALGQTFDSLQPFTAVTAARGAAGAERLYAVVPNGRQIATTSREDPRGSLWSPWRCFGSLSAPTRLAATELPDGSALVLAATQNDGLFARRGGGPLADFGPWSSVDLPSESGQLEDVAVARGAEHRNFLYVVNAGRVLFRYGTSTSSASQYTGWSDLGFRDAVRVAATVLPNLAQIVFALKRDGTVEFASQTESTPGTNFDTARVIPLATPPGIVDLEAAFQAGAGVTLWVLDVDGGVHATTFAEDRPTPYGVWSPWLTLPHPPSYLQHFTSLGALSALEPNHLRMLYAVSATGQAAYWGETDWQRLTRED